MNETVKQLYHRKSTRAFEERPIAKEDKQLILNAALQAPTAGNMALYSIIDVTDQGLKDRLAITCDDQPFIAKAPLVLVFLADYRRWYRAFGLVEDQVRGPEEGDLMLAFCDALIAAQNAVVAAEALGIGSCYIGDILERYEEHKALLKLEKYVAPACMLVFGHPTEQQKTRIKPKRFAPSDIVYENAYRDKSEDELRETFERQTEKQNEAFDRWLEAFLNRKYHSDFSVEMSRSVRAMLADWAK